MAKVNLCDTDPWFSAYIILANVKTVKDTYLWEECAGLAETEEKK